MEDLATPLPLQLPQKCVFYNSKCRKNKRVYLYILILYIYELRDNVEEKKKRETQNPSTRPKLLKKRLSPWSAVITGSMDYNILHITSHLLRRSSPPIPLATPSLSPPIRLIDRVASWVSTTTTVRFVVGGATGFEKDIRIVPIVIAGVGLNRKPDLTIKT
ncbi:hypothetical protein HKD37_03G008165 [Glycine soja]